MGNLIKKAFTLYGASISAAQIRESYYSGLNSLLANGNINSIEYQQRLINLLANK